MLSTTATQWWALNQQVKQFLGASKSGRISVPSKDLLKQNLHYNGNP